MKAQVESRRDRTYELPVACSLPSRELEDRLAAWQRLADGFLQRQTDIPGGVALTYSDAPGVEAAVRELARLESACCGWATWRVRLTAEGVRLEVTAPGDRERAVRAMFATR